MAKSWKIENIDEVQAALIKPGHPLERACQIMEYEVFIEAGEEGYVTPNDERRVKDYDAYPDYEYIAAFTGDKRHPLEDRTLTGVMRLTYSDADKMDYGCFPTIDAELKGIELYPDMKEKIMQLDPKKVIDIASMAIPERYRNAKNSKTIITGSMFRTWNNSPKRYALAFIDTPFYQKLKERNIPFQDLSDSVMYMGSESTACILDSFQIPKGMERLVVPFNRLLSYCGVEKTRW